IRMLLFSWIQTQRLFHLVLIQITILAIREMLTNLANALGGFMFAGISLDFLLDPIWETDGCGAGLLASLATG
ncbi:hypothetical protein QP237_23925, partial [Escherichia coli]|nr:hypothetical protein [Escherichia coli]